MPPTLYMCKATNPDDFLTFTIGRFRAALFIARRRITLKKLALFCLSFVLPALRAQTINPNQIRPGANGQILTTQSGVTAWGSGTGGGCAQGTCVVNAPSATQTVVQPLNTSLNVNRANNIVHSTGYSTIEQAVAACTGVYPCEIDIDPLTTLTQSTSGTYSFPGEVCISGKGGLISPGAGKTLDFTNSICAIVAPTVQLFGPGTITGLHGAVSPEWFAVLAYTTPTLAAAGADDSTRLQRAIAAITQGGWIDLQCASYHFESVAITTSNVSLIGQCPAVGITTNGTYIVSNSDTATQISLVGPGSGVWIDANSVKNVILKRMVNPTGTATGYLSNYARGGSVDNVIVLDSIRSFYFHASPSGSTSKGFSSAGWDLDYSVTPINPVAFYIDSADGVGESTLPIDQFGVSCIGINANSPNSHPLGMLITGTNLTDINFSNFGTAQCYYGLSILGTGGTPANSGDMHLNSFTLDDGRGPQLQIANVTGQITMNDLWIIMGNPDYTNWPDGRSAYLNGVRGVNIANSQLDGDKVFYIQNSTGVNIHDSIVQGAGGLGSGNTASILLDNSQQSIVHHNMFFGAGLGHSAGSAVTAINESVNNQIDGNTMDNVWNGIQCDGTSSNALGVNTFDPSVHADKPGCTLAYDMSGAAAAAQTAAEGALTGDITKPASSFVTTLATVNTSPGLCGDATHVCQITANGKGLTTSQAAISITGGGGAAFQVNGTSLSSATTVNYRNGSGNGGVAVTNPSAGNVDFNLSLPIAGAGPGFTTGPNSGVTPGDIALFTGTGGQITDGVIAGANLVTAAATLTANQIVLGAGSKTSATLGSLGTTTTVLHGNAAGAPTFGAVSLSADVSGNLPNANLAAQTANTVLGALTATTPSGLAIPSCSAATNALLWTSGTGFGCNVAVNAATLGGATFAAPGPIGSTTPSTGAFTTLSSTLGGTFSAAGTATSCTNPTVAFDRGGTLFGCVYINSATTAIHVAASMGLIFDNTFSVTGAVTTSGTVTSNLGTAAITSATGAAGVTSVTCATANCTVYGGTYTVVGGTATTGTFVTLLWPTTTTAWRCQANMNGGTGFLGIGHSVATATGMTLSTGVTILGVTFSFDYSCQP